MGTNHQQGVKKLRCRLQSLELCHIQLIWVQSLCLACRLRKFPWAGQFFAPLPYESRWVDGEGKGWVSSGWVGVTGGKMEGEDQWGSTGEKVQKSKRAKGTEWESICCVLCTQQFGFGLQSFRVQSEADDLFLGGVEKTNHGQVSDFVVYSTCNSYSSPCSCKDYKWLLHHRSITSENLQREDTHSMSKLHNSL